MPIFIKKSNLMKKLLLYSLVGLVFISCAQSSNDGKYVHKVDWSDNQVKNEEYKQLESKSTYLPIYSDIYDMSAEKTRNLTVTVSIHNMNYNDSLYILKAQYFNSKGDFVRNYIEKPIYLRPMETGEIVIYEWDDEGGTGANFLIEWKKKDSAFHAPLIEGVMISTGGQQGISFTTRGVTLD